MKIGNIAIALFLLLPLANAIPACPYYPHKDFVWESNYQAPTRPADSLIDNCANLDLVDKSVCGRMGNLTDEEKKILITDNLVRDNGFPSFQDAFGWNTGLQFTKYPPDNTSVATSGSIRDAWVKILSLSPSVLDNPSGQLFINDTGELHSQYAFSFVVKKETFSGDCRTDYDVCGYDYSLQNFQNGNRLADGINASFEVQSHAHNSSNNFLSTLNVNSEYLIHHYSLVTRCSGSGIFRRCVTTCEYASTESRKSALQVSDNKTAYYYNFIHFPKSIIDYFRNDVLEGWLFLVSNEDFNNFRLSFGNSWLKIQGRQYRLAYSLPPYNVLTPEALAENVSAQVYNIAILDRQDRKLSGAEFDDFLKVNEPVLHYILTEILHIDLANLPIKFYGDRTHFQLSSSSASCTLEVHSHFENWNYPDFCADLNQTPVIALNFTQLENSTFQIRVAFSDNTAKEPFADKKISLKYANQNQTVKTDSAGQASAIFTRTPVSDIVYAEFITDFQTKSAKAIFVLPAKAPDFFSDFWYALILIGILWILYELARRLIV